MASHWFRKGREIGTVVVIVVAAFIAAATMAQLAAPLQPTAERDGRRETPAPVNTRRAVPEMADILSDDQAVRLKATRRLAERVGVEEALEILEASALPHTGEGHLAVHQVGFYAYQQYGTNAILHCKDYFLYACYHGAIIEAASDQGLTSIQKMANTCKESPGRYFQCAHATGHALLAMWNYDLPEALADCDQVFEKETAFPDAVSSCHNGAFMENLFGVHDWGTGEAPKRDWLRDDEPYFPCTAFEDKYQKGCWLNQAARIYALVKGDIGQTRVLCERAGNAQYTDWCIDNLARQIHPLTAGDVTKVFALCSQVGTSWYEKCVVVNAGSYYSVGDPATAIAVCHGSLSPAAKADCYNTVMGQLVPDINLDRSAKEELCRAMEPGYSDHCLNQVGLWKK